MGVAERTDRPPGAAWRRTWARPARRSVERRAPRPVSVMRAGSRTTL